MIDETEHPADLSPMIHVTMIGGVPFATPTPKPVLTPKQAQWIERAWIAAADGRKGAVEHCVSRAERMIWPRGFDPHHARRVSTPTASRDGIRQAQEARTEAAIDRAARLNSDDAPMSGHEETALRMSDGIVRQNQRGERVRTIGRRHQARVENDALVRRMDETVGLAEGRGEETERLASGAVQVITHDLLLALVRKRKLTVELYDVALVVRDLYEARSSGLGAMEYSDTGRGGSDHEMQIIKSVQRAKKLQRLGNIERCVLTGGYYYEGGRGSALSFALYRAEQAEPHVGLQMLRAVIGEGVAISSFGAGRAFDRHLGALRIALKIAEEVCGKG